MNATQRAIKIRDYIDRLIPNEYDTPIDKVHDDLKDLGAHRIGHSDVYGGFGYNLTEQCLINTELARTRLCFRNRVSYTASLAVYAINRYANHELALEVLSGVNDGDIISFALTEPDSGSSIVNMKTSYFKDHTGYYLTGDKNFIGNSILAKRFLIFARNDKRKISAFLVDRNKILVDPPFDTMGQDGIHVSNIHFNMAEGILIGEEGEGGDILKATLAQSRIITSAVASGMATRAIESTITFILKRGTNKHQMVRGMLAESFSDAVAIKAMVKMAAGESADRSIMAASTKLFTAKTLNKILDNCVQLMGGYGVVQDNIVEEFYRDARVFRIYEGTDEIMKLSIAKELL